MARDIYQGIAVDGMGRVINNATITVYEAGGTTAATVYESEAGAALTNSQTTSDTDGTFSFWIDHADYALTQRFKITIVLANYVNQTFDDLPIFQAETIITPFITTLLDDANQAAAQTTLGVVPGTNVQPLDAGLTSIAGLTTAANKMIYTTALDAYAVTDLTAFMRTFLANSTAATAVADLGILALNNDWTAGQFTSTATLTDGTVALDYQTDMACTLLLEENSTLSEPSNKSTGDESGILLFVTQDGTGGRTLSFNAAIDFAAHDSAVNEVASKTTIYYIWTDGTQDYARRVWIED